MIVAGGALMATGLGGPIGVLLIGAASGALMSAGASAVNQKAATGTVDWGQVGTQAIAGAGAGAIGAGVGVLGAHALTAVSARIASRGATAASGAGAETVVTGATQTATDDLAVTGDRLLGETPVRTVVPKPGNEIVTYYPTNNGFLGPTSQEYLYTGQRIDRFGGSDYSRFFAPQGTPAAMRSLPSGVAEEPLRTFEVVKPFPVQSGTVAPAIGQMGLGTQYVTPVPLRTLLEHGVLREVG
jgi:hypothetical protein